MKIHVWTQDSENYGTESQPHWKMKGGEDFFIPLPATITERGHIVAAMAQSMVAKATAHIERDNAFFRRFIMGWDLVEDNYLTEFEQSQLDYEGKITYSSEVINVA